MTKQEILTILKQIKQDVLSQISKREAIEVAQAFDELITFVKTMKNS